MLCLLYVLCDVRAVRAKLCKKISLIPIRFCFNKILAPN